MPGATKSFFSGLFSRSDAKRSRSRDRVIDLKPLKGKGKDKDETSNAATVNAGHRRCASIDDAFRLPISSSSPSFFSTLRRNRTLNRENSTVRRYGTLAEMARTMSDDQPSTSRRVETPVQPPVHARPRKGRRTSSSVEGYARDSAWGPPPAQSTSDAGVYALSGAKYAREMSASPQPQQWVVCETEAKQNIGQSKWAPLPAHARRRPSGSVYAPQNGGHRAVSAYTAGALSGSYEDHGSVATRMYNANSILGRSQSTRTPNSGGLNRSSSISSTSRARPTRPSATNADLQVRASQFIGRWPPSRIGGDDSSIIASDESHIERSPPSYWICMADEMEDSHDEDQSKTNDVEVLEPTALDDQHVADAASFYSSLKRSPSSASRQAGLHDVGQGGVVWAVSRGWRTGLYTTYEQAHRQISGFPGPLVRQFATRAEACTWLAEDAKQAQRIPSVRTMAIDDANDDSDDPAAIWLAADRKDAAVPLYPQSTLLA